LGLVLSLRTAVPTATHHRKDGHDTASSPLARAPATPGTGWMIQRAPFQRCASSTVLPRAFCIHPTSTQNVRDRHATELTTSPRRSTGDDSLAAPHCTPFQTSGATWVPGGEPDGTATQKRADAHERANVVDDPAVTSVGPSRRTRDGQLPHFRLVHVCDTSHHAPARRSQFPFTARRDSGKLAKALQRDFEEAQKRLASAPAGKPARARAARPHTSVGPATARRTATAAKTTTTRKRTAPGQARTAKRGEPTAASSQKKPTA